MTGQNNTSDSQELQQRSQKHNERRKMNQAHPIQGGVARGDTYKFQRPTGLKEGREIDSGDVPLDLPLDLPVKLPLVNTRERQTAPTLHKKKRSYDLRDDFQNAELIVKHCLGAFASSETTDRPPDKGHGSEGL